MCSQICAFLHTNLLHLTISTLSCLASVSDDRMYSYEDRVGFISAATTGLLYVTNEAEGASLLAIESPPSINETLPIGIT